MKKILCVVITLLIIIPLFGCSINGGISSEVVLNCTSCGSALKVPAVQGELSTKSVSFFSPAVCENCNTPIGGPMIEELLVSQFDSVLTNINFRGVNVNLTAATGPEEHFSTISQLDYYSKNHPESDVSSLLTSSLKLISSIPSFKLREKYITPLLSYVKEDSSFESFGEYKLQGLDKSIECSIIDIPLTAGNISDILSLLSSTALNDDVVKTACALYNNAEYSRLYKSKELDAGISREQYVSKALETFENTLKLAGNGSALLGLGIGRRTLEIAYDTDRIYAVRIMDSKGSGYGFESFDDFSTMTRTEALVYYDFGMFKKDTTIFVYNTMQKRDESFVGSVYTSDAELSINYVFERIENTGNMNFSLEASRPEWKAEVSVFGFPTRSEIHINYYDELGNCAAAVLTP